MPIPPYFSAQDGALTIAGHKAEHWVELAGDTPVFVYDKNIIAARIKALRTALGDGVELHYAIKANPMPAVVEYIADLVDGLDVASAGELEIARATSCKAEHISFAGPAKRDRELEAAVRAGIVINIESEGEYDRLLKIAQALACSVRAAVRVNPSFEVRASGMKMGGGAKAFGIDAARVPALLARWDSGLLHFEGFQIFSGSQNLSADALIEAQEKTLALAAELAAYAPSPVRALNIGGGFGIAYFPNDTALDLEKLGTALADLLARRDPVLAHSRIIVELGRYIVGEAGVYLTRIVDQKISHGEKFLLVDGGLHHQLAASGNFGTVIRRNYPLANASRFTAPADETVNIVGCLCTPLDRLADKIAFPASQVGDLVAIFMAGAYGRTASPEAFLGHPPPKELLVG